MVGVAIVGIGCRLPGKVRGPGQLWDFLLARGDGIIEVPADRWNLDRFYDPDPEHARPDVHAQRPAFCRTRCGTSTRNSSGYRRARPRSWTRSSGCCSRSPRKRWTTPGCQAEIAGRQVGVYVGGFMSDNNADSPHADHPGRNQLPHTHGRHVHHAVQPDLLRLRPARSEHDHRHRLLLLPGCAARGDPGDRPG